MATTKLSISNFYNTPKVSIKGVTTLKNILLSHGVISEQAFINYVTKLDNNEDVSAITNIIVFNSIDEVNKYKCQDSGFYTLFIRNTDDETDMCNFMSTFPMPEIVVVEEDKKIKITIHSELEVTTIKIANGYVTNEYFINNGDRLPIETPDQKEFIFKSANLYGKYTVYVTMRTGLYTSKQFLIGSNFLSRNEVITGVDNKYYAMLTDYASRDLERFYDNVNVVYPLVSDVNVNQELTDLLSDKATIKRANLIHYQKFTSIGHFDIIKKYIDGANVFTIHVNIPVSLDNNDTFFIYGFVVYSEVESAPMIVYKLDQPIRKESTVNTDIKLPLSVILSEPRSSYASHIFDDANDIVTKSYLDQVLSTYNDKYAYADKLLISDLQNRINFKFSDVDPELQELKNIANTVNTTKDEIIKALTDTKREIQEYQNQIYEEVENYLTQTKKDLEALSITTLNDIETARNRALTELNTTKNEIATAIKAMVTLDKVEVVLNKTGLYKFMEIPAIDEDKHEFIFNVEYPNSGRELHFYLNIYTSKLDIHSDKFEVPYLDFPFVSLNADKFSQDPISGPYGMSFLVHKQNNATTIYLYITEIANIKYNGRYKVLPNISWVSTDVVTIAGYETYKVGATRDILTCAGSN